MTDRAATLPPLGTDQESRVVGAHTVPSPGFGRTRFIVLGLLALLTVAAGILLLGTEQGRMLLDRDHLARLGDSARQWVDAHPVVFLLMFVAAYVICAILLLPVWWLQIIAGFAFGLFAGVGWVMLGSTAGALATAVVSGWLGEEFVRSRIIGEGKVARRMSKAIQILGRNGLLVVFICRLSYPIPYGVSNYLFGLSGIKRRDIALGTAMGGIPIYAGWVAAGARPDWLARWEFWTIVIGVNLVLLIPLVVRSMRRQRNDKTE